LWRIFIQPTKTRISCQDLCNSHKHWGICLQKTDQFFCQS
jgi:hypothetical protein